MSSNEIETNVVNRSQLAEQGPLSGKCSWQGNIIRHHANPVITKRKKWTSQENKIFIECYLLSEPNIRGYIKCMLSLRVQKGMFWVSEQRLVDQANTIRRNSWMTKLERRARKEGNWEWWCHSRRGKKCWGFAWSWRRRCEKYFAGNGSRRAGW